MTDASSTRCSRQDTIEGTVRTEEWRNRGTEARRNWGRVEVEQCGARRPASYRRLRSGSGARGGCYSSVRLEVSTFDSRQRHILFSSLEAGVDGVIARTAEKDTPKVGSEPIRGTRCWNRLSMYTARRVQIAVSGVHATHAGVLACHVRCVARCRMLSHVHS